MLRVSRAVTWCIFLLLATSAFAKANPEKFNYELDEERLLAGELQVFETEFRVQGEGKRKRVVGVMILKAPPDRVWEVLEDWDAMGEFVPGLEYNKTIHVFEPPGSVDKPGNSLIEGQIRVLYLTINYTLDVKFDKANYRQEWSFVTDEQVRVHNRNNIAVKVATAGLKNIEGFEYIEPYGNGSSTIYYYAPIVETSVPLPEFVENALTRSTLNGYMEGIREMVDTLDKRKAER